MTLHLVMSVIILSISIECKIIQTRHQSCQTLTRGMSDFVEGIEKMHALVCVCEWILAFLDCQQGPVTMLTVILTG